MMLGVGQHIDALHLAPGDLLFPDPGHVQIYLGQGSIVEAPSKGLRVRVVPVWGMNDPGYPLWTARRVTTPGSVAGGDSSAIPVSATTTATTTASILPWITGGLVGGAASGQLSDLLNFFPLLWNAVKWIADPNNWLRIAEMIGGLVFIVLGLKAFGVDMPKLPANIGKLAAAA
jgi:hypothetical protein